MREHVGEYFVNRVYTGDVMTRRLQTLIFYLIRMCIIGVYVMHLCIRVYSLVNRELARWPYVCCNNLLTTLYNRCTAFVWQDGMPDPCRVQF